MLSRPKVAVINVAVFLSTRDSARSLSFWAYLHIMCMRFSIAIAACFGLSIWSVGSIWEELLRSTDAPSHKAPSSAENAVLVFTNQQHKRRNNTVFVPQRRKNMTKTTTTTTSISTLTRRRRQSNLNECLLRLEEPISRIQQRSKFAPVLQSLVRVDDEYRVVLITEHLRGQYYRWTVEAKWTCDGLPARLHPRQRENDEGVGGTFVITCPLTVQNITGIVADGGKKNSIIHYNATVWKQCSDSQDEIATQQGIPAESSDKVMCTMIRGLHWELAQWIEYHRMIGFEHFLIYLNEQYNATTLPDAADITYIPWNYKPLLAPRKYDYLPHQAAQQMDCILRAQNANVTWLALPDVDEYFQIVAKNETLDEILSSHQTDDQMGGLQLPSWFWGANHDDNNQTEANVDNNMKNSTSDADDDLMIDTTWRRDHSHGTTVSGESKIGAGREKMIVRPRRVVYFACHKIIVVDSNNGTVAKEENRIRMNHYKEREEGVYPVAHKTKQQNIVKDESFRDAYASRLREGLKSSLAHSDWCSL